MMTKIKFLRLERQNVAQNVPGVSYLEQRVFCDRTPI